MENRKAVPNDNQKEVLIKSRRRCCLCYGLKNDLEDKKGQIAHLDKNRNNNKIDNLAFLCLEHHDQYDTKTSQSKNYIIAEVKKYRDLLYERLEEVFDSYKSKEDYLLHLQESIKIKLVNQDGQIEDNSITFKVTNQKNTEPILVKMELWNDSQYEVIINKVEMQNKIPFHACENWVPIASKGLNSSRDLTFRYKYKHINNFELENDKYINLFYLLPGLNAEQVQKVYSLEITFLFEVTIPSKSLNYKENDIKREISQKIKIRYE